MCCCWKDKFSTYLERNLGEEKDVCGFCTHLISHMSKIAKQLHRRLSRQIRKINTKWKLVSVAVVLCYMCRTLMLINVDCSRQPALECWNVSHLCHARDSELWGNGNFSRFLAREEWEMRKRWKNHFRFHLSRLHSLHTQWPQASSRLLSVSVCGSFHFILSRSRDRTWDLR